MTKADRSTTASPVTSARRSTDRPATNRRTLLAAPALLGLAAVPAASAAATAPDTVLLQLGERFEVAWTAERAAWNALSENDESSPTHDHACDLSKEVGALADEIERSRATILPGLLVKGRALRWSRGRGDAVTIDMFDLRPLLRHWEPSDEQKLIVSILGAADGTPLHGAGKGRSAATGQVPAVAVRGRASFRARPRPEAVVACVVVRGS